MKKLLLLSIGLLAIQFACTNMYAKKVEAKPKDVEYLFRFTDAFRAIDGKYKVDFGIGKKTDFEFSVKDGEISISSDNEKLVAANPDNTITVEGEKVCRKVRLARGLTGAVLGVGGVAAAPVGGGFLLAGIPAIAAIRGHFVITGKSGALKGKSDKVLFAACIDHIFTIDGNAAIKKIIIKKD